MANQQLEALEGGFAAQSNKLHEKVLDLNCSMSDVAAMAKGIMNMRNQLLGMYGVPPDPQWNPNAPTAVSATSGVTAPAGAVIKAPVGAKNVGSVLQTMDPDQVNWKSLLNTAMSKTRKTVLSKDTIVYTPTGSAAEGGYWCTVASQYLSQEYSCSMPCVSKKAAESSAARVAVEAEFADCMLSSIPKRKVDPPAAGGVGTVASDKGTVGPLVQAVVGRPLTKADLNYTVFDQGDGTYIGSVSFPGIDPAQSFTGPPAATKKEAEHGAAKACLPWLQSVAAPALEQQKAKKAKKDPQQRQDKQGKAPPVIHEAKTPGAQVPVMQAVQPGAQQFGAQQLGAQPLVTQPLGMQNMVNMATSVGRWGW